MRNILSYLVVAIVFLGTGYVAGGVISGNTARQLRVDNGVLQEELASANRSLDDARRTLESARNDSAQLELKLSGIAELASGSAESVNTAIARAGTVQDNGRKIVLLVGAISSLTKDLRRIIEQAN